MKQSFFMALAAGGLLALTCCTHETPQTTAPAAAPATSSADLVKQGEYLVLVGGCNDCHSPKIMTPQGPVPDPQRLLSGHPADEALPALTDKKLVAPGQWVLFSPGLTAAVGPWGTTFAANITPDDTGIGNWTEAQFLKALREGKSKGLDGTRPILPPMPWPSMAKMKDDDLKAIFAYLQSLPPVKNVVANPVPPAG
ncbi:MAG: diheme cytochrome c-553 [Saprospiraceae bacterium]|nr:diheme cytochrome c-553 [Saprospiraceae bacterium]